MNFISKLKKRWDSADSLLCVGLDPQIDRIPEVLRSKHSPYFEFCKEIVDATHEFVCAFKPQAAYFSAVGAEKELEQLINYIKNVYPEIPVILDAKRGDIGSTAALYAQEAYQRYGADAVTVNPYLGFESIEPYMNYSDKGIVVLCRTSNAGSDWLQKSETDSIPVYQRVAQQVAEWNEAEQFILVTGATYPEELGRVRQIVGDMPLLVPGIGAQGGDIEAVLKNGLNKESTGLIISSSREILYAHEKVEQLVDISRGLTASRQVAIDTMSSINKYRNTL
mgnify:FL=1